MVKIGKRTDGRVTVMSRRGHGSCCCVVGCSLTSGTNAFSRIRMFQFPKDKMRWRAWVVAVQREAWEPKSRTRICSTHFISGRPSADPGHPDYVPSIFPNRNNTEGSQTLARFHLRQNRPTEAQSVAAHPMETDLIDAEEEGDVAVRTALSVEDVDQLQVDNEALKTKAVSLEEMIGSQEKQQHSLFVGQFEWILHDDKHVHFYTGLPSASVFFTLLTHLIKTRSTSSATLTLPQQFLLVLMKLRLGLTHHDLACRFQVSIGTVSTLCGDWLEVMARELQFLVRWQSRREIRRNLPYDFSVSGFARVRCIIDCVEVFAGRPTSSHTGAVTSSDLHDKFHSTFKFLVGVSPSGAITFLSKVWGGHVSGEVITKNSGLIDLLEQGDHVMMADQSLHFPEYFASKDVLLRTPPSAKGKGQHARSEVVLSGTMSRMRINVDMAIGKIKSFRILSVLERSKETQLCTIDKLVIVCAALSNLGKPLVSK